MALLGLLGRRNHLVNITVSGKDAQAVIEGFRQLNFSLQKKYLAKAIKQTADSKLSSLKAGTPRNRGKLANAVGAIVNKPKRKPAKNSLQGTGVVGRLGYRRGQTATGRALGGNVSHFVESGVKARSPRGRAFRIEWRYNRKYQYLKPLKRRGSDAVFLEETKPVRGQKYFQKWVRKNRRSLMQKLKNELTANLKSAIAEGQKRALRSASKKLVIIQ
jgi:hypothetical protein